MSQLPKFEYFEPRKIEEVCSLLSQYQGEAKVLAGGTDLLVRMKQGIERPKCLVALSGIGHLSYINYDEREGLKIGSSTSLNDLVASKVVSQKYSILGQAVQTIASRQVRNRATLGGNLCNASPAADTVPALIGLRSQVKLTSLTGERVILLEEFFSGPGCTVLQNDEILTEIEVPIPLPRTGGTYLKLSLREKDLAVVAVAAVITLNKEGKNFKDVKIVLGAVAPTAIRSFKAEEVLIGKAIKDETIRESAKAAALEAQPISDIRSSAEYRRGMIEVLTERAIKKALKLTESN